MRISIDHVDVYCCCHWLSLGPISFLVDVDDCCNDMICWSSESGFEGRWKENPSDGSIAHDAGELVSTQLQYIAVQGL